jgi:hypothetical protein
MPNGFGRGGGFGRRGGWGFSFRGSSPPWPYVGVGRGGLPRHEYFLHNAGYPPPWSYEPPAYNQEPPYPGYAPFTPQMTREEELDYLKNQAEAAKEQLDQIESRIRDLEGEKEE